ncbi:MAG TPA: KpsF/GutQ family sugar-phosphate isomerase [Rhodospirillaceae bacterium]|nr:KpsF/GutQ family sugar-phosphate isomerase [Rhodospirillaceae bacterium]HAA91345.1 KpsF/GutQ family sugar-phosphate isomerase [Rhodospirillaceae bacterium]HAT35952.1 KpsF/GutQ family sugar-phosphate isomerase [Rhodospirillaceae bacterium]
MTAVKKKNSTASDVDSNTATSPEVAAATRVLRLEAEAIQALADQVDGAFGETIEILHQVSGRIIVTGMGKSGHIARKIAATLASTGSPAQYVHPGEASHGDLGMITDEDAVIALSNSGETDELRDLMEYSRRYSIPLIAITSRDNSTLGDMADTVLLLPDVPEGCPMGLAPTTSTTASLALGDAIAVALLERKGFSANDFRVLHPGGKLGSSLLRVSDLMHSGEEMPLVAPDTKMSETIVEMTTKSLGCVGIIDDNRLVGIVTDGDLRRHLESDLREVTANDIMTASPTTIRSNALAAEALAVMNEKSITNLFVIDEGAENPVGVLHIHDCLRAGLV